LVEAQSAKLVEASKAADLQLAEIKAAMSRINAAEQKITLQDASLASSKAMFEEAKANFEAKAAEADQARQEANDAVKQAMEFQQNPSIDIDGKVQEAFLKYVAATKATSAEAAEEENEARERLEYHMQQLDSMDARYNNPNPKGKDIYSSEGVGTDHLQDLTYDSSMTEVKKMVNLHTRMLKRLLQPNSQKAKRTARQFVNSARKLAVVPVYAAASGAYHGVNELLGSSNVSGLQGVRQGYDKAVGYTPGAEPADYKQAKLAAAAATDQGWFKTKREALEKMLPSSQTLASMVPSSQTFRNMVPSSQTLRNMVPSSQARNKRNAAMFGTRVGGPRRGGRSTRGRAKRFRNATLRHLRKLTRRI
jgi:hypothetical protein